jgi:hydrogenase nickel incorporation protein HypA/HybF
MHEMSLMNDLFAKIDGIAKEHGVDRISGVKVHLGALAHISPDHFREHFEEGARGTVAEGARLHVSQGTDQTDPRAGDIVLESVDVED